MPHWGLLLAGVGLLVVVPLMLLFSVNFVGLALGGAITGSGVGRGVGLFVGIGLVGIKVGLDLLGVGGEVVCTAGVGMLVGCETGAAVGRVVAAPESTTLHILTVASWLPVKSRVPSGEKASVGTLLPE